MKTYSEELKASIIVKLLPPNHASVPALAREYGIPRDTLYSWRRQAGSQGALPATPAGTVGALSGAEKFAVVVETATLNELDLGAYCRRKGLFAEQIATWRTSCQRANDAQPSASERAERRAEREQIKQLSHELQRKDKALAEAAALLLLQKKSRGSGKRPRALPQPRAAPRSEHLDRGGVPRRGASGVCLRGRGAEPAHPAALAPEGRRQRRCPSA